MKLIVAISALAALVAAQDISSLPACGQLCVNNMLSATGLGCSQGDWKCFCTKTDFGNGLRDCSAQACGGTVPAQVVAFGQSACSSATAGGSTTTATTTTTTGASSSGGTSASSGASSASASASSAIASAKSSASNAVSSVSSSAVSAASSAASKASSSASSSSSAGFAMKTQAPLAAAGVLGIAALLV